MKKSNILLYVLAGVLGILVFIFFVVMFNDDAAGVVGEWFGTNTDTDTKIKSKKDTLEFLGWGISGVIAFYGLFALNRRAAAQDENNKLIEKGHVQDRFRSAVDHLSNKESVSGRIASFYEFFYLAKDVPDYAENILGILCAHLRHISNVKEAEQELTESQTLVDILFSFKAKEIFGELNYDLRRVKLRKVDFRNMHKPKGKVDFSAANLSRAVFDDGVDLSGFIFQKTKLHKTKLWGVNLQGADLRGADLRGADFFSADFKGAVLIKTDLRGTYLGEVKGLEKTLLSETKYGEDPNSEDTIFPDGFNPKDHNMKYCPHNYEDEDEEE